jgi:hypothetical protein
VRRGASTAHRRELVDRALQRWQGPCRADGSAYLGLLGTTTPGAKLGGGSFAVTVMSIGFVDP